MRSFSPPRSHRWVVLLTLGLALGCGSASGSGGANGTEDSGVLDDGAISPDGPDDSGVPSDGTSPDGGSPDGPVPPKTDGAPGDTKLDAPVPPPSASISLLVFPDDGKTVILDAIKSATKTIHVEVYLLTDTDVTNALIAAKSAGRSVSVLLEKNPYPSPTENQSAYDALKAGGVTVAFTTGIYPLTHSKFMVIDAAKAYVMTLNLTVAGIVFNREYAAVDTDVGDVAEAEQIFAADVAGTVKPTLTGGLIVSPVNARVSLTSLIDSATKSLDLEFEEISDATVVTHLEAAASKGVSVRVIAPGSPDASTATALTTLKGRGVQVRTLASPDVHAKAIVVDGARLYVGSINLTKESMDRNREVGVITDNATAVARAATRISADFTKATPY